MEQASLLCNECAMCMDGNGCQCISLPSADSALTYYGDPLQDFSLGRFLDRFAFKNPKKPKTVKDENGEERLRPQIPGVAMRKSDYAPAGFRALPVNALAKDKCAEDDEFILK